MQRAELARLLAQAGNTERIALLKRHAALADVELARALKALYDDTKVSEPARGAGAAAALTTLADTIDNSETHALAAWTAGMAALQIEGAMEQALARLDEAVDRFETLQQPHTVAIVQVSRLHALAMLGWYDEAIACGLQSRDILLAHGDILTAGKIEQNLGNIHFRRDDYNAAEQFYRAARDRFAISNDRRELAKADNNLAIALTWQYRFRAAAALFEQALTRAAAEGLEITQAEIECNLGTLTMFQGHYDRALDYLERSRRRYALLEMPHESAIAELALADAYLELNLAPEAAAIYKRVTPIFAKLGMRSDQAWAITYHAHACLLLGEVAPAKTLLAEAQTLYAVEGNAVGEALVRLTSAHMHHLEGDYAAACADAARAEVAFTEGGTWGRILLARWLHGEATRALHEQHKASALLESALRDAQEQMVPQITQRCLTSLGLLAASVGDTAGAEAAFKRTVALIEEMRAPLPAEEFRTAFVADKLTPYAELARLCLADGRVARALDYVERMRSRALVEMLGGTLQPRPKPNDQFEARLLGRLEELREALNWFYSQVNRPLDGEMARGPAQIASLQEAIREREAEMLEITRQVQQRGKRAGKPESYPYYVESLDIEQLQHDLGAETALVEYFSLGGELLAFVVTNQGIEVKRCLGQEEQVAAALEQFRFQIGALRNGAAQMRAHLDRLALRARHYLQALYDLLLRPLEAQIGARRLVVVPHRALHYVPFHALYDGAAYAIERREIVYTPSASVLRHCLARPRRTPQRALLLGVPDERAPQVRDEVAAVAPLFPDTTTLLDADATLAALRLHAPGADVLHLACHGQFRPDSPLFSSLRLADGWLTVRDAYSLNLNCELVALSACETGVSAVAPGDELIGMARGFFSAGAPALLVSLWTVDDATTATLMVSFYARLRAGAGPAAALRQAQRELLERHPHPFFWSPFVLLGRW